MRKGMLVASLTLLAVLASGASATLAGTDATSSNATDTEAAEAQAAFADAQTAVKAAAEQRALWTTAQSALAQAQAALEHGKYEAARELAEFAAEQARLGIAQMGYKQFQ